MIQSRIQSSPQTASPFRLVLKLINTETQLPAPGKIRTFTRGLPLLDTLFNSLNKHVLTFIWKTSTWIDSWRGSP